MSPGEARRPLVAATRRRIPTIGHEDRGWPVVVWTTVNTVVQLIALVTVRIRHGSPFPRWADVWIYVDGQGYLEVTRQGYEWVPGDAGVPTIAYYPGYPILGRLVEPLLGDVNALVFISMAAGLISLVAFDHWLVTRVAEGPRRLAVVMLAVWPWAFVFYGAAYADSLAIALVVGAFVALENRHVVRAVLLTALATATKQTAIAAVPALVVTALEQGGAIARAAGPLKRTEPGRRSRSGRLPWRVDTAAVRPVMFAPLLGAAGLAAFMAYCGWRFGRPLLFAEVQSYFGAGSIFAPGTWLKVDLIRFLLVEWQGPRRGMVFFVVPAVITVLAAVLVPAVARRFGLGAATFVAGIVAITWLGSPLANNSGRHLAMAVPLFALIAERIADRPWARRVVTGVAAVAFAAMTVGWAGRADWYF